jgi:hypothetical protein
VQDSLAKVSHLATKEEGYEVVQRMLATLGMLLLRTSQS